MNKVLKAKIEKGKIIPDKSLPVFSKNVSVKIFIFDHEQSNQSFFGKGKGIFGDGLKFQKKIRKEWK